MSTSFPLTGDKETGADHPSEAKMQHAQRIQSATRRSINRPGDEHPDSERSRKRTSVRIRQASPNKKIPALPHLLFARSCFTARGEPLTDADKRVGLAPIEAGRCGLAGAQPIRMIFLLRRWAENACSSRSDGVGSFRACELGRNDRSRGSERSKHR